MLNVIVWPDSSAGPGLIAVAHGFTVCGPASSATVWFGPAVKLGASLMPVTLIVIVAEPDCGVGVPLSVAVTVSEKVAPGVGIAPGVSTSIRPVAGLIENALPVLPAVIEIGRASCRERV